MVQRGCTCGVLLPCWPGGGCLAVMCRRRLPIVDGIRSNNCQCGSDSCDAGYRFFVSRMRINILVRSWVDMLGSAKPSMVAATGGRGVYCGRGINLVAHHRRQRHGSQQSSGVEMRPRGRFAGLEEAPGPSPRGIAVRSISGQQGNDEGEATAGQQIRGKIQGGSADLASVSLHGLAALSTEIAKEAAPQKREAHRDLEEVASTIRMRLSNKSTASVRRWELDSLPEILAAFVSVGFTTGQAAGMFDAIAKAVSRLLRTGAVDLSSQAADVDALLEQLLRARHRSIAVSDLLTCLAGAMRSEIGYEFLARANIVGAKAGVAVMGGAANGAPLWMGSSGLEEEDFEDGSMPIATVCRLLELFGKHGYHPGALLLDAAGPYSVLCFPRSRGSGTLLLPSDAAALLRVMTMYRHHPGERLLRLLMQPLDDWATRQGTAAAGSKIGFGIEEAAEAARCCAELGTFSSTEFRHLANALLRQLGSHGEQAALRDDDDDDGDDAVASVSVAARSKVLWCACLAGVLDEETLRKGCRDVQQASEREAAMDTDSLVRLAHAVQLTSADRTETGLQQLQSFLGSGMAAAAIKSLQLSTRATHSAAHVGMQSFLREICGSCQAQVYLDNGVYADFVVPWPPSASDAQPKAEAAYLEQPAYSAASSTPSLDPTSSSAPISAPPQLSSTPGAVSAPHQSPSSSLSPTTQGPNKATTNETAISRRNYRFIAVLLEGPECRLGNRSGIIAPSSEVRRRLLERSAYLVLIIASEDWMKKQSSPKPAADRAAFLLNRLHSISSMAE